MKNLIRFAPLFVLLAATLCFSIMMPPAAASQTLNITATSVEVISSGAKTRAFYGLDDVYFINAANGGFAMRDASNGTVLFDGDTAEVSIPNIDLWEDKQQYLFYICRKVPYTADVYPQYYLPTRGVNYLYKSGAQTIIVSHSKTKHILWRGDYDQLYDDSVSDMLEWIRGEAFQDVQRNQMVVGPEITAVVDTTAGSGATVEISGRGTGGNIFITTGTSVPEEGGLLCTVTLPAVFSEMRILLTPANQNAAGADVYARPNGGNQFQLFIIAGNSDEADFEWYFNVTGFTERPD